MLITSLEPILKRTLGVPLFQEQLLRIAMIAANFTGGEKPKTCAELWVTSDSRERMLEIENRLRRGMDQNGIWRRSAARDYYFHCLICPLWVSRITRRQALP